MVRMSNSCDDPECTVNDVDGTRIAKSLLECADDKPNMSSTARQYLAKLDKKHSQFVDQQTTRRSTPALHNG